MYRTDWYTIIKAAGLASLLPFVLFAAPFAGYLAADFLHDVFGAPFYLYYILCGLGLLSAILETMRILKALLRMQGKRE